VGQAAWCVSCARLNITGDDTDAAFANALA